MNKLFKDENLILERDNHENGITCLANIFCFWGFENLRDNLRESTNCYSHLTKYLVDLIKIAENLGFETKPIKIRNIDKFEIEKPLIILYLDAHLKRMNYKILYKRENNNFYLIDTILGKIKVETNDFKSNFSNIAIEINPTFESFKK